MMSLIRKSTFLDPRFRTTFNDDEKVEVKEEIRSEMLDILDASTQEQEAQDHEQSTSSRDDSIEEPPRKKPRLGGIGAILKRKKSTSTTASTATLPHVVVSKEIELYINEQEVDLEISVIDWWKQASFRMPLLSQLARKYLCICATSVVSERMFSTGGNIVNKKRSALKPDMVNQLVFLAKNLKE